MKKNEVKVAELMGLLSRCRKLMFGHNMDVEGKPDAREAAGLIAAIEALEKNKGAARVKLLCTDRSLTTGRVLSVHPASAGDREIVEAYEASRPEELVKMGYYDQGFKTMYDATGFDAEAVPLTVFRKDNGNSTLDSWRVYVLTEEVMIRTMTFHNSASSRTPGAKNANVMFMFSACVRKRDRRLLKYDDEAATVTFEEDQLTEHLRKLLAQYADNITEVKPIKA
jgi:hypothetical protein